MDGDLICGHEFIDEPLVQFVRNDGHLDAIETEWIRSTESLKIPR